MNEIEIVRLKDIRVNYGDIPALEDVTLSVFQHDFLGIIGPNGGGKSTLLKVLLGLVKPYSGSVSVFGKPPEQARSWIGYVSQRPSFDHDCPPV
jgi:zinc transport system ATP-binding protein